MIADSQVDFKIQQSGLERLRLVLRNVALTAQPGCGFRTLDLAKDAA